MINKREVILIALGQFGKTVSEYLENIIEERHTQLGNLADSVVLHPVIFEDNEKFMSSDNLRKIRNSVKDSKAEQMGEKFSYILIGDLYEPITSRFAIDYAYLPHILNLDKSLPFEKQLGFFTFADTIGTTEKVTDESIADIKKFFDRLNDINKSNYFEPPFKDIMNKKYPKIASPIGPFDRNYFIITRGGLNDVTKSSKIIFAERIFYELFYLNEEFNDIEKQTSGELSLESNAGKNFCCFSMIQIPRINEIQKYYLKFTLENEILKTYLAPSLTGTDEDYYKEKFFDVIDIPINSKDFPIRRAIELFQFNNHEDMARILEQYYSNGSQDFKDYMKIVIERLNNVVSEMRPRYDEFSKAEISYMNQTLTNGFIGLFKLDRIAGNINTYLKFVYDLKDIFENWESSLDKYSKLTEIYSLGKDIDRVEKKIAKYKKNVFLNFILFRPIRKKLIENQILSLPLEEYIASIMQSKLALSLLVQWKNLMGTESHPISFCNRLIENLEKLKTRLESKQKLVESKINFIEDIDSYFYIIRMFDNAEDYTELLNRIKERNFGPLQEQTLINTISRSFKDWITDKDLIGIVQDATGFIKFLDEKYVPANFKNFDKIEENPEQYANYVKDAATLALKRTEDLNNLSFRVENRDSYISKSEFLLEPVLTYDDILVEEIKNKFPADYQSKKVPNDFTMGSVVYFKDYLYMSQNDLCKKIVLDNYSNISTSEREYDNTVSEPIPEPERASETEKSEEVSSSEEGSGSNEEATEQILTLNLIKNYLTIEQKLELYREVFDIPVQTLADIEIEKLAKTISYKDVLKHFTDEQIFALAKDKDLMILSRRDKMEKRIIMEFEDELGE